MWANHQWTNMFPATYYDKMFNNPYHPLMFCSRHLFYIIYWQENRYSTPGALIFDTCKTTPAVFQNLTVPAIIKYFLHPQYPFLFLSIPFWNVYHFLFLLLEYIIKWTASLSFHCTTCNNCGNVGIKVSQFLFIFLGPLLSLLYIFSLF